MNFEMTKTSSSLHHSMAMSTHFGFKSWSPTREIWDVEVDILCIGSQVSSALKACTPDMVAATFQDGLEHQSAEGKK